MGKERRFRTYRDTRRTAADDRHRGAGPAVRFASLALPTKVGLGNEISALKGQGMGKLVIKHKGKLLSEVSLKLGDTKIGRLPGCDIILNDGAVSGEHAVIKTVGLKSTIQDLESTNGTFIENKRVTRHELRHGETIMIGAHTMLYREELDLTAPAGSSSLVAAPPSNDQEKTKVLTAFAQLLAMEGAEKGKRLPLIKEEIVFENAGKSPARILRTSEGYVMHAAAGPGEPRVNEKPIPPGGQILESGDNIEIAGTKFRFFK